MQYLLKSGLLIIPVMCIQSCAMVAAQPKKVYNMVTDFGAKGDNTTNNYAAFQRAATTLSGKRNVVLQFPKGQYYIADYKITGGPDRNMINDVIFKNITGLQVEGNNSTVRVNGKFHRSADYKNTGVPYLYAYKNSVSPLSFTNCRQVVIKDIVLDGGVQQMTRDGNVIEGSCYGLMILDLDAADVSSDILVDHIETRNFATDGLYIRSRGKNIRVKNARFMNNGRQGASVVRGTDIFFDRCVFDSTGYTGSYGRHAPTAGLDIENEYAIGQVDRIHITNCSFRNNLGFQFVSTANSGSVRLDSCFMLDNKNGYADGFNGVGMYSANSSISNCIIVGMLQMEIGDQTYQGNKPQVFKNNIIYSGHSALLSADYNTPMEITGNLLIMLPRPVESAYFPFIRNQQAVFSYNMIVAHTDKLATHTYKVMSLVQKVKSTTGNFWFVSTGLNTASKAAPQKKAFYALNYDGTAAAAIGNQFFPSNEKIRAAASPTLKFVTDHDVDELLGYPLFRDFSLRNFNPAYLADAVKIRAKMKNIAGAAK